MCKSNSGFILSDIANYLVSLFVNDRVRFTISPEARKEVLRRLLELNHKIHAEEVAAGLWDKKKTKNTKTPPPNTNQTGLFG